jgi:hydroxymethylpyrimidine/phosphomethylpyrimidine kinase
MHTALTIAGSDSSGGAGIQGDLKTFAAHGVYGVCAVTAVTAQNTMGVSASAALASDLVAAQIEAVAADFGIDAVKTGMLADAAIVEAVAAAIDELELPNLVVDPVIAASGGTRLLDADGVQAMMALLFPRARVVTPNIPEAEALGGRTIGSMADLREAARRIHAMGPTAVIITGGHAWDRAPRADIVDLLFDGRTFAELRVQRVAGGNLHGTGCAFASSVAAHLARGVSLHDAAARAQQYVARALAARLSVARGGALDHFAPTGPP